LNRDRGFAVNAAMLPPWHHHGAAFLFLDDPMRMFIGLLAALLLSGSAFANDGFAGLSSGGLEFGKTDDVAMVSEDLYLSPALVRVTYVFRNTSDEDVEAIVAFPMPPLSPGDIKGEAAMAPEIQESADLNLMKFRTTVNGAAVNPDRETKMFLRQGDDWGWGWDLLKKPGADVTQRLRALEVPETFDTDVIMAWYNKLPKETQRALADEQLFLDLYQRGSPLPAYVISTKYFWTQNFPAGRDITVVHEYRPIRGGSVFYLSDDLKKNYCVDAGTEKAILAAQAKAEQGPMNEFGFSINYIGLTFLDYILTTANTWKGPIGKFHLTLDKGSEQSLTSLCLDGIKKTGKTTFEIEKTNFSPKEDIRIVFFEKEAQGQP
jgi:hypothetical protein